MYNYNVANIEAKKLYNQGKYWEASVLYERCLFELADDTTLENNPFIASMYINAIKDKISCLKLDGNVGELPDFINRCRQMDIPDSFRQTLAYDEMIALYLSGSYTLAIEATKTIDTALLNKKEIQFSKIVNILSLNELNNWTEAKTAYLNYIHEYVCIDSVYKYESLYNNFPLLKSEKKAMHLSTIFPGLGLVYAGKPIDGLSNLLFQTGSAIFTWTTWQSGYWLASLLVGGSVFDAFRSGGKRKAKNEVIAYNNKVIFEYKNRINQKFINTYK